MNTLLMTPGPTYIKENVRLALAKEITNPDLDLEFFDFYKNICSKLQLLLNTKNKTLVLAGEGILGLEAACASLIEDGDKVLCIENGIYGEGFGGFGKMYGGRVDYFHGNKRKGIDINQLENFLKENHDYKIATLVHCETPSGITNPVKDICKLLNSYNIISVVDAVSSIGGEEVYVDDWNIDIIVGGSQKCLSAPVGLTFLSLSSKALDAINNRTQPIRGFYTNLSVWNTWYEDKWFPYTQPISDLYAFDVALDNILEDKEGVISRHSKYATALRNTLKYSGLELFPKTHSSNTVSTILVPIGLNYRDIFNKMLKEHNIMIAGGFDFLQDKVFRIGHMGENCYEDKLYLTLKALDSVLRDLGLNLEKHLHKEFVNQL
ncbi:pyridoxal-phosphate-dependent aminotransferase family protein [Clostridium intestinale]|uniref:Class V aminotransferase n=1 Tax=Clostridium intestinale URNW TaxID=1294142 RepID=U2NJ86_9CLOT|nr:alanine--glyoxylate aminotransferase family protein [Clostridium intestinale]ERK29213.1 class V aminotransferase [Clostridium intestinale URNW]